MNIGWPQGITLGLLILSLGVALAEHGRPRGPSNAWMTLIATIIHIALLWWGGFFR